jgi:hypothetical protein
MKFTTFLVWFGLGIGMFGWAAAARGEDQGKCYRRIQDDRSDLARAIERHGPYSSQARHERNELQREEAKCGYFDRNDEAEDRWRGNGGPYDDSRYDNYGQRGYESPAFDIGYRDGLAIGRRDRERGKAFRPDKNDYYEDADRGYEKFYGDKGLYRIQYREAFQRGYADGYDDRR